MSETFTCLELRSTAREDGTLVLDFKGEVGEAIVSAIDVVAR